MIVVETKIEYSLFNLFSEGLIKSSHSGCLPRFNTENNFLAHKLQVFILLIHTPPPLILPNQPMDLWWVVYLQYFHCCWCQHRPVVLRVLLDAGLLHGDVMTVTGRTMAENLADVVVPTDQDNIDQGLSLIEVDAGDYDWTPGTDYTAFTPVEVVSRSPAAQTMSGFSVSATTLNGAGSRSRAAIRLEWTTTGITDVDGVQYEVRLDAGDVFVVSGETDDFARGYAYISHNILSATNYEVRARYRAADRLVQYVIP